METYQIKLLEISSESRNIKTLYFEKPANVWWEEGAHCHIKLFDEADNEVPSRKMVRHMSIMTLPSENRIAITTRVPGSGSEFKSKLDQLQVGDSVILFKIGSRMSLRRVNRPIVLLSMGVAIATMRPLIQTFAQDSTNIPELWNIHVDSSRNYLFYDELRTLQTESLHLVWTSSRSEFYESLHQSMNLKNPIFYVVGSDEFVREVTIRLLDCGVFISNIILDKKEVFINEIIENYRI